jgi:hypothetical protein
MVNGKWEKDFEYKHDLIVETYKDGRMVESVSGQPVPANQKVTRYPTPETMEQGDGKRVSSWWKYQRLENGGRLPVYRAVDTNGDGDPDVVADLVKVTITQPEKSKGP